MNDLTTNLYWTLALGHPMRSALLALVLVAGCAAPAAVTQPPPVAPTPDAAAAFGPGWPDVEAAVLRPGVKAGEGSDTVGGHFCTTNFVFSSPDNRTLYLGVASHCVSGLAIGDDVPLASGAAVARLAYCSYGTIAASEECPDNTANDDETDWNDFALLEIADGDRALVHPAILRIGGPTSVAPPLAPGDRVRTYGNSDGRDLGHAVPDLLDAREGVVTQRDAWITEVAMAGPGIPGDSGSPVIATDGGAVGVMKYLSGGTNGVTNLDAAVAYLHEKTLLRVELKTWPLL